MTARVLRVAGPGAVDRWSGLSLVDQRVIVRALFSSLRAVRKRGQSQVGRRGAGLLLTWRDRPEQPLLLP